MRTGYVVGVDFGERQDYSTVVTLQRFEIGDLFTGKRAVSHVVTDLHRYGLRTDYSLVARSLVGVMEQLRVKLDPPFLQRLFDGFEVEPPVLVVDPARSGRATCDQLRAVGLRPVELSITDGVSSGPTNPYEATVPKRELSILVESLMQDGRLQIPEQHPLSSVLANALEMGADDDLTAALMLACWVSEYPRRLPKLHLA